MITYIIKKIIIIFLFRFTFLLFIGVALETSILYFICGTHSHKTQNLHKWISCIRHKERRRREFQLPTWTNGRTMWSDRVRSVFCAAISMHCMCDLHRRSSEKMMSREEEKRRRKKKKTNEKKKFHQLPTAIVCNYKMIIIIWYKKWAAQRRRAVHIKRCEMEAEEEKTEIKSHTKLNM